MLVTYANIANELIYANKVKKESIIKFSLSENNLSLLINTLKNLRMQAVPFHNFIFCLKLASVSDSLISSGNSSHKW